MRVIDVSDPQNPVEVGWCDTPGSACQIVLDSVFAYVADGDGGLRILDISNPANPIIAGSCDSPGLCTDLEVQGNLVYLADGMGGLRIIDASDPSAPIEIAAIPYWGYDPGASAIAIAGDYAYVHCADCECGEGGAIYAVNVANPSNPFVESRCGTGYYSYAMEAQDTLLFVGSGTYWSGIHIYNLDQAPEILPLSLYNVDGGVKDIFLLGNTLYYESYDGLGILDISNPRIPLLLGSWSGPAYPSGLWVENNLAYIAGSSTGLLIANVSDPANISVIGNLTCTANLEKVAVQSNYAYVTDYYSGLRIFDISSPQPLEMAQFPLEGSLRDICLLGDYALVPKYNGSLCILDISNPLAPALIHEEALMSSLGEINVFGNLAYLGAGYQYLLIVDISDFNSPILLSQTPLYGYPYDISVAGDYGYAACAGDGLATIDLSDPADPDMLHLFPFPQIIQIEVAGQTAYLLASDGELLSVDISDPVNPVPIGSLALTEYCLDLRILGDYAYIGGGWSGLRVVNISNPAQPVEVGYYTLDAEVDGMAISGDYAYLAANDFFVVLDHSQASPLEEFAPDAIPNAYALHAPHPNPFNAQAKILIDLPKAGHAQLAVYDVQGKRCATLLDDQLSAGRHELSFDGRGFSSGIYLAKLEAGDFREVRKMVLVK